MSSKAWKASKRRNAMRNIRSLCKMGGLVGLHDRHCVLGLTGRWIGKLPRYRVTGGIDNARKAVPSDRTWRYEEPDHPGKMDGTVKSRSETWRHRDVWWNEDEHSGFARNRELPLTVGTRRQADPVLVAIAKIHAIRALR